MFSPREFVSCPTLRAVCGLLLMALLAGRTAAQAPCGDGCGTVVPPGPPYSGTWSADKSPYCVTGDISIGNLTVEPGVCILLEGPYAIEVLVRVRVMGTAEQPVTITSKNPEGRWGGMLFNDTGEGSEFNYCTISRSDNSAIRIIGQSIVPPVFRHCRIADNTAFPDAGGIRAAVPIGQTLILEGCVFEGNIANPTHNPCCQGLGGALYLSGSAIMTDCVFDRNEVWGTPAIGSSMFLDGGGTVEVSRTTVLNGLAQSNNIWAAGAIVVDRSTLRLENSIIACNDVRGHPAAGGSVSTTGGGGDVTILNCTIARNAGYGLAQSAGVVRIRNSILYFNNKSGDQYGAQYAGEIEEWAYSDVQNEAVPGPGNLKINPAFNGNGCDACSLGVISFSPVVDMGDPDPAYNDTCFPPSFGGERNDMGAHGGPLACGWVHTCYADCDRSCTLDLFDFLCFTNGFNAEDAYSDCDGSGVLDLFDFLCFVNRFNQGC